MQKETKFSILFRHWIKRYPQSTAALEMKQTKTGNFRLSQITQEQIDYGLAISSYEGVLMRTQAVATGMPDYVYLRNVPSFVVIQYPGQFSIIDMNVIASEIRKGAKTLSKARAEVLGVRTVKY